MINFFSRIIGLLFLSFSAIPVHAQKIDRKQLVRRHNIIVTEVDSLSSLTVGSGKFAYTVDVTGLQTFPEFYIKGIPLGTQSEWGWHSFIDTSDFKRSEAIKTYHLNGRDIPYTAQWNSPDRNMPGNGGLLMAIAMMCAGYDGSTVLNPGIPKNGKWKVKWEGLRKMP